MTTAALIKSQLFALPPQGRIAQSCEGCAVCRPGACGAGAAGPLLRRACRREWRQAGASKRGRPSLRRRVHPCRTEAGNGSAQRHFELGAPAGQAAHPLHAPAQHSRRGQTRPAAPINPTSPIRSRPPVNCTPPGLSPLLPQPSLPPLSQNPKLQRPAARSHAQDGLPTCRGGGLGRQQQPSGWQQHRGGGARHAARSPQPRSHLDAAL